MLLLYALLRQLKNNYPVHSNIQLSNNPRPLYRNQCETKGHGTPYRSTWGHDSIINTLLHNLRRAASEDIEIFGDCGLQCTSNLFQKLRPGIVVRKRRDYYVIELTVPYETNCKSARRCNQENIEI